MAKPVNYKTYKKKFLNLVKRGVPVTGVKYDTEVSEIIENADDFKQCYSPELKVRKQLPKYWFVSKEGFLVSVKGKNPTWVRPNLRAYRPTFKPSAATSTGEWPKNKPISTYDLVALVWGSDISEDAQHLLDTAGASCLGFFEMDERNLHKSKVQGHHWKRGYIHEQSIENYILNNDPSNIQMITNKEHFLLDRMEKAKGFEGVSFYAPKYRNVYSNAVTVYIMGEHPHIARYEDVKDKIVDFIRLDGLLGDKDFLIVKGYQFVSTGGADFIEDNKDTLLLYAENNRDERFTEFYYGKKYYYVCMSDGDEIRKIYYRKIKK